MGFVSKATSQILGLKSMALSGNITLPVAHQPLERPNDAMDGKRPH